MPSLLFIVWPLLIFSSLTEEQGSECLISINVVQHPRVLGIIPTMMDVWIREGPVVFCFQGKAYNKKIYKG